jgi:hypothetical protein
LYREGKNLEQKGGAEVVGFVGDINLRAPTMVVVDLISGEKFAQPGGAKIGAFGVNILRSIWGIYRQNFVAKGLKSEPKSEIFVDSSAGRVRPVYEQTDSWR